MVKVNTKKKVIERRLKKEGLLDIVNMVGTTSDRVGEDTYLVGDVVKNVLTNQKDNALTFVSSDPKKVMDAIADDIEEVTTERPKIFNIDSFTKKMVVGGTGIEVSDPIKEIWSLSSLEPKKEKGNFLDDALGRTFTIDALALGTQAKNFLDVVDYTGKGVSDLGRKILRTPLDADEMMRNDPAIMLEVARLSACDNFKIAEDVRDAIKDRVNHIDRLSVDVIREEMDQGILCGKYIATMDKLNLMEEVLPEIGDMKRHKSGSGIVEFNHTIQVSKGLPKERIIRWVGLLHDLGIITREEKHAKEGKEIALSVLERFKFPEEDKCHIAEMVGRHKALKPYVYRNVPEEEVKGFILDNEPFLDEIFTFAVADKWGHWNKKKQTKKIKLIKKFKKQVNRNIKEMCEEDILPPTSRLCGNDELPEDFSYCSLIDD